MDELSKLAAKYGTDKCPQIGHSYTPYYYDMFKDRRKDIKKVLEIGVGVKILPLYVPLREHKNMPNWKDVGASLYMWRDFFPNAQIYGIDNKKDLIFKDERIQTFLCDQTDKPGLVKLIKKIGKDIDIVIDDGSHIQEDAIVSFLTLMPLLKKSVTYIIEDVNQHKAIVIAKNFKNYNYRFWRRARMTIADDRLIIVTNKNG